MLFVEDRSALRGLVTLRENRAHMKSRQKYLKFSIWGIRSESRASTFVPGPSYPHYYYTTLRLACQQAICTKKITGGFHHQFHPKSARVYSSLYSSKKLPSSQQLQQATSSMVSIMKWIHSSQLHFFIALFLLRFVIVFAGRRPRVIIVATGVGFPRFLPVVSAVAISTSCHRLFPPILLSTRHSTGQPVRLPRPSC